MTTQPLASKPAELTPPASPAPDDPRVVALMREMAERLRGTCAGMDPAAFDRLVRDLARMKISWVDRYGERLPDV